MVVNTPLTRPDLPISAPLGAQAVSNAEACRRQWTSGKLQFPKIPVWMMKAHWRKKKSLKMTAISRKKPVWQSSHIEIFGTNYPKLFRVIWLIFKNVHAMPISKVWAQWDLPDGPVDMPGPPPTSRGWFLWPSANWKRSPWGQWVWKAVLKKKNMPPK